MAKKNNFGVMVAGGGDQSKRSEHDFYGTPREPTVAMLQHYIDVLPRVLADLSCGAGHLVRPMVDMGFTVLASDLYHRGFGYGAIDFLKLPAAPAWRKIGLRSVTPCGRNSRRKRVIRSAGVLILMGEGHPQWIANGSFGAIV